MIGALIFGAMALVAGALVLLPLARKGIRRPARAAFDRAVYRDQLAEIDRDRERGVIGEAEADAARTEIARRLLAADREAEAAAGGGQEESRSRLAPVLIIAAAALIPAGAAGLYLALGAPGLPDQPLAERQAAGGARQAVTAEQIARIAAMIETRLKDAPDNPTGWRLLTMAYVKLGRDGDAEKALARADALMLARGDRTGAAALQVQFAEELMARAGGQVEPRALAAVNRALAHEPGQPAARYYLGLARLQAGDGEGALAIWAKLAREAPKDAPWLATVRQRIERLARARGLDPGKFLSAPGGAGEPAHEAPPTPRP